MQLEDKPFAKSAVTMAYRIVGHQDKICTVYPAYPHWHGKLTYEDYTVMLTYTTNVPTVPIYCTIMENYEKLLKYPLLAPYITKQYEWIQVDSKYYKHGTELQNKGGSYMGCIQEYAGPTLDSIQYSLDDIHKLVNALRASNVKHNCFHKGNICYNGTTLKIIDYENIDFNSADQHYGNLLE